MVADEVAMCCLIEIAIIVDVVEILACFSKLFRSTKTKIYRSIARVSEESRLHVQVIHFYL